MRAFAGQNSRPRYITVWSSSHDHTPVPGAPSTRTSSASSTAFFLATAESKLTEMGIPTPKVPPSGLIHASVVSPPRASRTVHFLVQVRTPSAPLVSTDSR